MIIMYIVSFYLTIALTVFTCLMLSFYIRLKSRFSDDVVQMVIESSGFKSSEEYYKAMVTGSLLLIIIIPSYIYQYYIKGE